MQPQMDEARVNARYRTLLILWGAFISFVGIYFVISQVLAKPDSEAAPSRIMTFALTATGTFLTIVSFALKQKFLSRAEELQSPALVQTGHIIAFALCEGAALLGLFDYLATGNRYYYVILVIALIGMVLHFPRRDQLLAAVYRQQALNSNRTEGQ